MLAAVVRIAVGLLLSVAATAAVSQAWGAEPEASPLRQKPAAAVREKSRDLQIRLTTALSKHLDQLLDAEGHVAELSSKGADSMTAISYYHLYELTGNQRYRAAAVELARRILRQMKETKFGVLYIKEKEAGDGEMIAGGGPPALGWYAAWTAYILKREGGTDEELTYLAGVIDWFPWNEGGWWANTVDMKTGELMVPLSQQGAVNKNVAMALAAAVTGECVRDIDPELSARLKAKADKCIYERVLPAQEPDGYWHYGFRGNDPNNKDILGYYMVTMEAMIQLQHYTTSYRDPKFQAALDRGFQFARDGLAPMTDPYTGPAAKWTSKNTPKHYEPADDPRRGFALGMLLFEGECLTEGEAIMSHWLQKFPSGNKGAEGAHAAHPTAAMLMALHRTLNKP